MPTGCCGREVAADAAVCVDETPWGEVVRGGGDSSVICSVSFDGTTRLGGES